MKRCWKCKQDKPISEFHKDPNRGDGHSAKCKSCMKEIGKLYWSTHTTVVVLRSQVKRVKEFIKSL